MVFYESVCGCFSISRVLWCLMSLFDGFSGGFWCFIGLLKNKRAAQCGGRLRWLCHPQATFPFSGHRANRTFQGRMFFRDKIDDKQTK